MTEQPLQFQLDKLRQTITSLREHGDNPAFRAALDELLAQETALIAQIEGTGTVIQGSHLEGGARSVMGATAGRDIITGDNNTVNRILNLYLSKDDDPTAKVAPDLQTTPQHQADETTLRRQIASYLAWMRDQHSTIELRGIKREGQQVVQLDLEMVYVPLAAETFEDARRRIALDQVLTQGQRVAITGGPGSGKTTVLLHLAWTLTEALFTDDPTLAKTKLGLTGDLPLPIFVPLSRYARHLRDLPAGSPPEDKTLAGFISRYQIELQTSFELPPDFFTELLRQGQAVILLLDGLDEVPNEGERVQVREAIENLVTGRDKMSVVVTCRTASYQGRTALSKGFCEVQVMPLDKTHLAALIRRAYKHLYADNPYTEQTKADELLAGISKLETDRQARFGQEVEPLVTSPLMVRMLLVVHYSERRLPDQRAELFMKATDAMLLPEHAPDEAVAEEIGSLVGGSREVHRELVQYLAFKMHERGKAQGRDIGEDDLRQILDSHPLYGHLTDDFIGLTRLRGTVLEERLGVYRFIHLAFQEYLAARYLAEIVRGESGVDGIGQYLESGPILDSWWREPALLVVGYLSVTTPQTAQTLLRRWAGLDEGAEQRKDTRTTEIHLAMAEVAGVAALEWPGTSETVRANIAEGITGFFAEPEWFVEAPPMPRVTLGRTLAGLGDPRTGVTTLVEMELCYVPKGPFWMGPGDEDEMALGSEKPLHQVDLAYDYWLARFPVTVAQFQAFVEQSGHQVQRESSLHGAANHPVRYVNWHEATTFCAWLTRHWQAQGVLSPELRVSLPSEAEWEKGARGGLKVPEKERIARIEEIEEALEVPMVENENNQRCYPWLGVAIDANRTNYRETGIGDVSTVGCFPTGASVYGCEEMSGNVWEWCRTAWQSSYERYQVEFEGEKDSRRVMRGGSYFYSTRDVRCAARLNCGPDLIYYVGGFRFCVLPHYL